MQKNVHVDHFIFTAPSEYRVILNLLRDIIANTVPDIKEEFKWNMPVYRAKKLCCYISTHKDHINLGFYKGTTLSDPDQLLEGTGKDLRHYKIRTLKDVKKKNIAAWLKEACMVTA
jgi:hypothetical protein